MIIGLGSDIVDVRRIKEVLDRHGDRFLDRCFTPQERAKADRRKNRAEQDCFQRHDKIHAGRRRTCPKQRADRSSADGQHAKTSSGATRDP